MRTIPRRKFLKTSGAVIGGLAAGTTVTTAESRERFIVDANQIRGTADVEIVHQLDAVDLLVVCGQERDVKQLGGDYARDVTFSVDRPFDAASNAIQSSATDEPLYPLQWDKQDQRIPEVHDVTRGDGARVAIIDSGIAAGHPDLEHAVNADLSKNFTEDGFDEPGPFGGYHGTHVAGIVAANDQNEAGVVGSAPGAELVDCRVFSIQSPQETLDAFFGDVLAAIVHSAEIGADAANLSLGWYFDRRGLGPFYGKVLNRTTTYAANKGTVLVHAAGNVSTDLQHDKNYVDTSESAQGLCVSATGPIGFEWGDSGLDEPPHSPAFYTNYGTNAIDFGAPGGDIDLDVLELEPENRPDGWYRDLVLNCVAYPSFDNSGEYQGAEYSYNWAGGTSMAAPQVTAAAALVRSANPDYTTNQVVSTLKRAADVPDDYDKTYYGAGYINLLDAVTD